MFRIVFALLAASLLARLPLRAADASQRNILFIAIDDLRAQLGCYGDADVISPNIDKLASRGTLFERAYCNVPRCGASRASVLTGLRSPAEIWNSYEIPLSYITLPAWLSKQGYHTVSNGKISHYIKDRKYDWDEIWRSSEVYFGKEDWGKYNTYGIWQNPDSGRHVNSETFRGPFCEWADVPDNAYQDGKLADKTIADLKRLKAMGKPFFLGCGFWRPHLPFNAPRKYWDLYDRSKLKLAENPYPPKNKPEQLVSAAEFDRYARTSGAMATREFEAEARHAYYACVSYVDAQVGRVMDALDTLGLAENTIVVLWSDHGFHLGEHQFWAKLNTLNNAIQVPLIIAAPGYKENQRTDALVELIDLYPTLCELSGLPVPDHLHGRSFVPLLEDPTKAWKEAVFSRFADCEAVKTDRYLYTEWGNGGDVVPMLFDHKNDPMENENIAGSPEAAEIVKRHSILIKEELARAAAINEKKF